MGGDLPVNRLGFGSMQLPGPGIWADPPDRDAAVAVLRRAVDLGVDFIDTADSYGPFVAEDLIREALHPYPPGLVVATKGGLVRRGPVTRDELWPVVGRPEYLRQCVEMSLRRLRLDTIDLYQLHRIDPRVPVEESLGELAALRQEGKIRHIGVSEVDVDTLRRCQAVTPIATVQNRYHLRHRMHDPVLRYCTENGLVFIPWDPLASGDLLHPDGPLARYAATRPETPAQVALGWLLHRSPAMLVIPGTSSLTHLADNVAAAGVRLSEPDLRALDDLAAAATD
ncbi:oxidoreductase [Micromonospora echinofusca]|uniref:Oxidoreductase n=1 Tax=Micromonospora echinofusca TaxID=47858 RepID=A0ABS3VJD5_MICEH|nr:oxidoreductase [Micromonospora echinofusca]